MVRGFPRGIAPTLSRTHPLTTDVVLRLTALVLRRSAYAPPQLQSDIVLLVATPGLGNDHCNWVYRTFGQISMLRQFLVGGGVTLVTIAIHALVMTMVVQVARAMGSKRQPHSSLVLLVVMIPTISVLMAVHVIEVFVRALAYLIFDAVPAGANLVYFAFVNYTTLGYGDVLPVERWRLLGPLTAMNGMLLFGWSTAVIFEVLRRTLVRTLDIND